MSGEPSTGELERTIVEATVTSDPNFRKGDLRVVESEGKIVSMMLIIRRQTRIGKAKVNNAIVAPVATRVGYEKKGYCSAVMRDAINYMKQQSFDITTLWGHPWLYVHYGYSSAIVRPSVAIKPERCKPAKIKEPFTIQPYDETQVKEVTDIYHNNTVNQILPTIRKPEPYEWRVRSPSVDFKTVIDKKGRITGYFSISKTAPPGKNILEVGVANTETCKIIFNKLLDYAKENKLAELVCPMSPQHPFAQFAYWQNAELRVTMADGAGFAQILNMKTLFCKMKKELENRLIHSEFYDKTLSLAVKTEKETVVYLINNGKITFSTDEKKVDYTVEAPLSSVTQLTTGYKSIYDPVNKKEVMINSNIESAKKLNCVRLINVIFPKDTPYDYLLPLVWE